MKKGTLICIVGPTAIGKTSASIYLAQSLETEIMSSDSRQFYKEMSVGTAVPSTLELKSVPHHFIQTKSIFNEYNVGDFEKEALAFISAFFQENNHLIMVGGSGLYEKAVTQGLNYFPLVSPEIEKTLNTELKEKGLAFLQEELKQKDEVYYHTADIDNPRRVIRALGVIRSSGKAFSEFRNQPLQERDFKYIKIGLTLPREEIYSRINQRVDLMIENGLIEEAQQLYPQRELKALQTVGYRELFDFFDGKFSKEEAIEEIKKNTRRFAKRQLTWYRKDEEVEWFHPTDYSGMLQYIESNSL